MLYSRTNASEIIKMWMGSWRQRDGEVKWEDKREQHEEIILGTMVVNAMYAQ